MALPGPGRGATLFLSALALFAAAFSAMAARAETQDLFTVRGIGVDVTADSAAEAREKALNEGQRRALDQLLRRLALPEDVAHLPPLSDPDIAAMVHDFQVGSERTSAVRYIGELTFRFRADPVRRLLEQNGIRFAAITSKPVLLLPVLRTADGASLWDDPNPWREAWAARPREDGLVPLIVPLGDLGDVAALDAAEALSGKAEGFDKLAQRYGTGDTIVAEARVANAGEGQVGLDISAKRYAGGVVEATYADSVTASAAERDALFTRGVERLQQIIEDAWKRDNLVNFGAEQTLVATVPITAISDWVAIRDRLDGIAVIRNSELLYLMRNEARLRLTYAGDVTVLNRALAQQDLSLSPAPNDIWVLRVGPPPATVTGAAPTMSGPQPTAPAAIN